MFKQKSLSIILISLVLSAFLLFGCGGGGGGGGVLPPSPGGGSSGLWPAPGTFHPPTGSKWTIMIYLDGDNSLEDYAFGDFNEMVDGGGSQNGVNVIVLMDIKDGPTTLRFVTPGGYIDSTTYEVYCGLDDTCVNMGELNMADPETLKEFVNWVMTNYPAEHYMLVLWDHGAGWRTMSRMNGSSNKALKEICVDETDGDGFCPG